MDAYASNRLKKEDMKTREEDAAFGCVGMLSREEDVYNHGLTKRELFAAMFMQSLLSNPERYKYIADKVAKGMSQEEASSKNSHKAVLLADALINELNKQDETD